MVSIQNRPGGRTRVRLTWPTVLGELIRVLVVDDHPSVRENLRYLVNAERDMDCVGVARDAQEAVRACQELLPDVVILDDEMPGALRNEIYARHGKIFKHRWLKSYFSSLPWYHPDPKFSESELNSIERHNVAVLIARQKKADTEISMTAA